MAAANKLRPSGDGDQFRRPGGVTDPRELSSCPQRAGSILERRVRVILTAPGKATPNRALYDQMLRDADKKMGYAGHAIKCAVADADVLATGLNASEKGALSPLVTAMQLDGLLGSTAIGGKPTSILRVAAEQVGGTAISRSGVLYTLGFPGAAVISTGVLVSFRLVDPRSGEVVCIGIVRCAVPQTRFGRVRDVVLRARGCDRMLVPLELTVAAATRPCRTRAAIARLDPFRLARLACRSGRWRAMMGSRV